MVFSYHLFVEHGLLITRGLNLVTTRLLWSSRGHQINLVMFLINSRCDYNSRVILHRMRCATKSSPEQTDFGRTLGLNFDRSTESGSSIYSQDSLIKIQHRVCTVWARYYLRSGQSDQSPAPNLESLIIAWSRVCIVVWYGLDSLKRAHSRVCTVWSETFPEFRKSAQNQKVQPTASPRKKEEIVNPQGYYFLGITSQFYLMSIREQAKDYVVVVAVELNFFYCLE